MLNHSCVRCRSKKLRCDGRSPCSNCHEKGVGMTCQRALRKERPRRMEVRPKTTLSTGVDEGAEVEQIPRIPEGESDRFIVAVPRDHGQLGVLARRPLARIEAGPSGSNTPDAGSSKFANRAPSPPASGEPLRKPVDVFQMAPARLRGCLVSIQQIERARRILGSPRSCGRLLSFVFHYRCQAMAHSAVHLPTLKKTFRQVFSDEWAPELTQDQLSLVLMAIAVSIQFTPRAGPYGYLYSLVHEMGSDYAPNERQIALHDMARQIITSRSASPNATLEGLQTIMLFLMYDLDDEAFKDHIFDYAVRSAQRLGFNHMSYGNEATYPSVSSSNAAVVEHEMMVRLWWYFVCRDWLTALTRGSYSLHPNHFSTRLPKVITDEELAEGKLPDSQAALWSPVSVSIPFIGLASLVRQMVDVRNQRAVDVQGSDSTFAEIVSDSFDQFAANIHPLFGLGAEFREFDNDNVASIRAVQRSETERWILHHQMFHAFLQLHEYRLDVPVPPVMAALAAHILDIQDKIRLRCHIIDSLRINVTGVLRAITVLCIDLMQKHKTSQISLFRQMQLGKIREALRKTKDATRVMDEDIKRIEKLLDIEDTAWRTKMKRPIVDGETSNTDRFSNSVAAATDAVPASLPGTAFSSPHASYTPRRSEASIDGPVGANVGYNNGTASGSVNSTYSSHDSSIRETHGSVMGDSTGSSVTGATSISSNNSASSVAGCSPSMDPPLPRARPFESAATVNLQMTPANSSGMASNSPFDSRGQQQAATKYASSNPPAYPSTGSHSQQHYHAHSAPGVPCNTSPAPASGLGEGSYTAAAANQGNQAASFRPSWQPNPAGPPPGYEMPDLAQWMNLLPTDQAVSPIFSNTANFREPTWEDLYSTFMQQAAS
ncbi:unnamed protein product [Parajaminaea phylloscopi]